MDKNGQNLIDLKKLDPAVASLITRGFNKKQERELPRKERKGLLREREKAAKRKERRVGYDMDPEVTREIAAIAERNETTASQVAQFALRAFLDAVHRGEIDLTEYRVVCHNNPRYGYMLVWRERE